MNFDGSTSDNSREGVSYKFYFDAFIITLTHCLRTFHVRAQIITYSVMVLHRSHSAYYRLLANTPNIIEP